MQVVLSSSYTQMPVNCSTCRPLIHRLPQDYLGCFVAMFVRNRMNERKNVVGLVIDYDTNPKKYDILLEEGTGEVNATYKKIFGTVKQFLKWNARRQ